MQQAFGSNKKYRKSTFDKYSSKPANKRKGHWSKLKATEGLMKSALDRYGIGRQVQSALIVQFVDKVLKEILPMHAKPDIKSVWFQRGELLIGCKHPAAVEFVYPFEERIRSAILRRFPDVTLEKITIKFHPQAFEDRY